MSSLKFSGALFLFLLSASHFSRVHVIWSFSGGASTISSSSSEYRLPIRTKECLSLTSWALGFHRSQMRFYFVTLLSLNLKNAYFTNITFRSLTRFKTTLPLAVFLHWKASFASAFGTSAPSLMFVHRCMLKCHYHARMTFGERGSNVNGYSKWNIGSLEVQTNSFTVFCYLKY